MKFRLAHNRGTADEGWLKSKFSFSFSHYQDPEWKVFGKLRVLNEDWIAPGSGFPMHPHKDMEIVTVMLSGEMRHRDSMGHEQSLYGGEVQAMSAGTGVMHSEWNPSDETAHLFQMWLFPEKKDLEPSYDQFRPEDAKTRVLASNGKAGLKINTPAEVLRHKTDINETFQTDKSLQTYVHIISGEYEIGGVKLQQGDAVAFDREQETLNSLTEGELLIVNMD